MSGEAHIVSKVDLHRAGDIRDAFHLQSLADRNAHRAESGIAKASDTDSFVGFETENLQISDKREGRVKCARNREVEGQNRLRNPVEPRVARSLCALDLENAGFDEHDVGPLLRRFNPEGFSFKPTRY
jgi:hypothetical protein